MNEAATTIEGNKMTMKQKKNLRKWDFLKAAVKHVESMNINDDVFVPVYNLTLKQLRMMLSDAERKI